MLFAYVPKITALWNGRHMAYLHVASHTLTAAALNSLKGIANASSHLETLRCPSKILLSSITMQSCQGAQETCIKRRSTKTGCEVQLTHGSAHHADNDQCGTSKFYKVGKTGLHSEEEDGPAPLQEGTPGRHTHTEEPVQNQACNVLVPVRF